MSKLNKRKTIVEVGKRFPTTYEVIKRNTEQALENARKCDLKLKQPIKYDLKRFNQFNSMKTHKRAMKICKILIESDLSITDQLKVKEVAFSFNEAVVWDNHFDYEIGYFLGEGHVYETYLIDVRTGVVQEPTCYPKSEIHKYSNELIDKLTKKYGYEKRFSDVFYDCC